MEEDRDLDKKTIILPPDKRTGVSKDVIKSAYLTEDVSFEDLADRFCIPATQIEQMAIAERWDETKKDYIVNGIQKIQNIQVKQAHKLIDIETKFKTLRIAQLEEMLSEFAAYYARYGDLKRRHPITNAILKGSDGMPMYLKVPNVTKELAELRESVTIGEGTKQLLDKLEKIVNAGAVDPIKDNKGIIDIDNYFEGVDE